MPNAVEAPVPLVTTTMRTAGSGASTSISLSGGEARRAAVFILFQSDVTGQPLGSVPLVEEALLVVLAVTMFSMSGQFTLFTYVAPVLSGIYGLDGQGIALVFLAVGVAGVVEQPDARDGADGIEVAGRRRVHAARARRKPRHVLADGALAAAAAVGADRIVERHQPARIGRAETLHAEHDLEDGGATRFSRRSDVANDHRRRESRLEPVQE